MNTTINERIGRKTAILSEKGISPALCIVRVGEDPGSISYEKGAVRRCESLGVVCGKLSFPADVPEDSLLEAMKRLNEDSHIHGVLLLRPLPPHLNQTRIENALDPRKDVDCMTELSIGGVFTGRQAGFPPCTPQACMEILKHYGIDCTGKRAVVVGRSLVVGKPLAMMLLAENATVTICHTRTKDMASVTSQADILIAAAGRAGILTRDHVRQGQIVIDVGINVDEEGRLCGDVLYEDVEPIVQAITPVPGGVGSVTTSILAEHVVDAAMRAGGICQD